MVALNITGTCTNCMMQFRFDAREIAKLETIFCPHCGIELEGEKIIGKAQEILKRSIFKSYIGWTCTNCKKQYTFDPNEVAKLTYFFCPNCKSGVDGMKIKVLAHGVLKGLNEKSTFQNEYVNQMSTSIQSIHQLYESSSRPIAAFVGSGLSIVNPTSLPIGKEVVISLLNLDWVEGDEIFPISESQIENSDLYKIRFEHLLSIFKEWGGHDIGHLLHQFADAPPNWYHKKIAELCREKKINCIITTNFDLCIEKAFHELDVAYNSIVYEDDIYSNDPNITNIFKIHGTIEFSDNRYIASGLGATLESIYSGLETWKRHLLLKLLDNYTFVFLGYSGYDSYDINPVFYEVSESHLFWVVHKTDNKNKSISSEVLNILAQSKYPSPIPPIDTAVFLGGSPLPRRESKFRFKPTYNLKNHWHPSVFVGRVLESINDYDDACSYYELVLEKSTGSLYLMVEILNLIRSNAVCLYELKKYEDAKKKLLVGMGLLSHYIKNLQNDESTPEKSKRKIILDQLLLICEELSLNYAELGLKDKAIEYIEQAFNCLENLDHEERSKISIESRLLLNQSAIKIKFLSKQDNSDDKEYLQTIEDLKNACKMKRRIGDVTGLIKSIALLGQIYVILGEIQSAEDLFIEMFNEIQKLKTPIDERLLEYPSILVSSLLFLRLTDYNEEMVGKFLKHKSDTTDQFKTRIKHVLINEVHKSNNQIMQIILKDEKILKYFNRLREEIYNYI